MTGLYYNPLRLLSKKNTGIQLLSTPYSTRAAAPEMTGLRRGRVQG
jgi:hypothetical protein